eukprot:scaffold16961_cov84-Isochrysis_galbana.AAC.1
MAARCPNIWTRSRYGTTNIQPQAQHGYNTTPGWRAKCEEGTGLGGQNCAPLYFGCGRLVKPPQIWLTLPARWTKNRQTGRG